MILMRPGSSPAAAMKAPVGEKVRARTGPAKRAQAWMNSACRDNGRVSFGVEREKIRMKPSSEPVAMVVLLGAMASVGTAVSCRSDMERGERSGSTGFCSRHQAGLEGVVSRMSCGVIEASEPEERRNLPSVERERPHAPGMWARWS